VSAYQNSFEKEIDLAVIFLFVALFLAAVSLALRRGENARARERFFTSAKLAE